MFIKFILFPPKDQLLDFLCYFILQFLWFLLMDTFFRLWCRFILFLSSLRQFRLTLWDYSRNTAAESHRCCILTFIHLCDFLWDITGVSSLARGLLLLACFMLSKYLVILKKDFISIVYVGASDCMDVCEPWVQCPQKQKGCWNSGTGVIDCCEQPQGCWEPILVLYKNCHLLSHLSGQVFWAFYFIFLRGKSENFSEFAL